jgi:hypothetical protein
MMFPPLAAPATSHSGFHRNAPLRHGLAKGFFLKLGFLLKFVNVETDLIAAFRQISAFL